MKKTLKELYEYDIKHGTNHIYDRIAEMTSDELEDEIRHYNRTDLSVTYDLCMFLETQMPYTKDNI